MRIAKDSVYDYSCGKCGNCEFGFLKKENQFGIYCKKCGRWLKWADKDEQNLYEMMKAGEIDD